MWFKFPSAIAAASCVLASLQSRPMQQPPSSLQPPAKNKASVRISHEARRVTSCTPIKKDPQVGCRPKFAPANTGTALTLHPLGAPDRKGEDTRRGAQITFPERLGRQEHRLRLGAGGWQLDWPPHAAKTFAVRGGEALDIALRTTHGSCRRQAATCAHSSDGTLHAVTFPTAPR